MALLLDMDNVRNLRQQRCHGHAKREAQASQERTQQHHLTDAAAVHGAQGHEEGHGEQEPERGGDAGPTLVAPVADQGRAEGGEDQGQEDESAAGGAPAEEAVGVEGEDGVPGGEEGGEDEGAEEGGEEAAGGEEGEERGELAFGGEDGWWWSRVWSRHR